MLTVSPIHGLGQDDVGFDPYRATAAMAQLQPSTSPAEPERQPRPDSGMPTFDPTSADSQPVDPYAPAPGPATEKKAFCPWWCWILLILAGAGTIGLIWYAVKK